MCSRLAVACVLGALINVLAIESAKAQTKTGRNLLQLTGATGHNTLINFIQEDQRSEEPKFEAEETESPYDEPIETDRHDFTQSSKTVGCGVLQLEYGLLYLHKNRGGEREDTWEAPEFDIRYGLNHWLEVQARWNYGWKFIRDQEDLSGGEDLRFAFKVDMTEQCGLKPESALEIRTSLPTGGADFTTGRIEGGLDYIYGWDFAEYFQLSGSSGFGTNALGEITYIDPETDRGDHFIQWHQSAALGVKLTRRSTGYFEWYGLWTHNREEEASLSFLNVGIDYLINNNTVVDVRLGCGLTEDSDNIFAGVGGAIRF